MILFVRFIASWRRFWDGLCTVVRDYRNIRFAGKDIRLASRLLWRSSYAISRDYHRARGEDPYQYGETLLTTLHQLVRRFRVAPGRRVVELGCGPGRTALWWRLVAGCEVVGIEQVPEFVRLAPRISGLTIQQGDFFIFDYSEADLVYLYGTSLSDPEIMRLLKAFHTLQIGARVITISYSLAEYDPSFVVLDEAEVLFPWGKTSAYLQIKKPN